MSSKTRKFIGPMSLVAIFAVVGALAAFGILGLQNAQPAEAQAQAVAPGVPSTVTVTKGNQLITVQWSAPATGGAVTGYEIEYQGQAAIGANPGTLVTAVWAGATAITGIASTAQTQAWDIRDLANDGMEYFARVRAVGANGTDGNPLMSAWSALAPAGDVGAVPAASAPGMPTGVMVSQSGTNELSVSWTAPANDGGTDDGITSYAVSYTFGGATGAGTVVEGTGDDVLTATITGAVGGDPEAPTELLADVVVVVSVVAQNTIDTTLTDGAPGVSSPFTFAEAPDISVLDFPGTIESDSTSGGGAPQFTVTIPDLTTDLPVGSSIVLYLEDDFQEPDSIPASSVYFVADQPRSAATGGGARVYASRASTIETDDYIDPTKNDISIRVFIPDMCTTDTTDCSGANGPESGQRLRMIIEDTSGIKNPTEFGSHSAAFDVLGPADSVALIGPAGGVDAPDPEGAVELLIVAKISLSDSNNTRGYEMTVTATGFNNGTSAGAYVLVEPGNAPSCADVISGGASVGSATVGSDDVASISFEVAAPTFKPGKVNYICVADGEGRRADGDVEQFELEDSIRVVPSAVNAGDTVTVFAQDFTSGLVFTQLDVSGSTVYPSTTYNVNGRYAPIGPDGSATITFVMPASIDGNPVVGIRAVKAYWGSSNAATTITVAPSELSASKTGVLPNETITITGNGYGTQSCVPIANVTLDNVPIQVDLDSQISCDPDDDGPLPTVKAVEVSNSGQFVATVTLWPEDTDGDNPTLISGSHTLNVEDSEGFTGSTTLTIAEPTISVTPGVVGPRDYIVISGANWPVDNSDNSNAGLVDVEIDDNPNQIRPRKYSVYTDGTGRFTLEHRVSRNVAIPSVVQINGNYGDSRVVKTGSFAIPSATITVDPGEAQPGDLISLSATDMKPYTSADEVKIGGSAVNFTASNTDIDGNITLSDLLVPGLDPGVYSVVLEVDETVAIGELTVLAEDSARGAGAMLPDALTDLGDSLVRVFHFNGVDKSWDFYDPRADFADLNTLTTMVNGEPYWILVSEGQENVVLNNRARTLTCVGGDCWNQLVW